MVILTINSGSSSMKFQVYDWDNKNVLAVGLVERIGQDSSRIKYRAHMKRVKQDIDCPSVNEAVDIMCSVITDKENGVVSNLNEIGAVGHRVSMGGEFFKESTLVDDEVIAKLKSIIGLAPLHLPANIAGVEIAREKMPNVPHAIVMDTAWHQTMLPKAFMYAVPMKWYEEHNVRRYGFHGTSFLYCTKRAALLLGKPKDDVNLIICHIGSGASMNAVKQGISFDTSMGFTPQEGLIMGTRCGDIDPAVIPYVMDKYSLSAQDVDKALTRDSGLQGICGMMDRRDILRAAESGNKIASLAIEMECYRIKKYIGSYMAALGKVDAVIFTAAAGEMSPVIRRGCLEGLDSFGIQLDEAKNDICKCRNAEFEISKDHSPVKIYVIPTDEEIVIAEDTYALINNEYKKHTEYRYCFEDKDYVNKGRRRALKTDLEQNEELKSIIAMPK